MTAIEIFDVLDRAPVSEREMRQLVGRLALMVDDLQARQRAIVAGLAGAGAAATCEFTACPKCGLEAKTLLHTCCQQAACPVRGAGSAVPSEGKENA